ncbi:MAG: pilus assembly protein PilP [Bacteriovorax sp.]|nr:pilus assembly protein PilP [Bacteriovorax sp.]
MKKTLLVFIFCVSGASFSQDTSGTAYSLFKSNTYLKNPLDLRDPFKRRINKKKGQQQKIHESGVYTNQAERIEDKSIESIRIVGVMIGKERRAIAKVTAGKTLGNEVYFIKEGMKLGPNGAEVKAILPGGVVLVEKIRNVYDQDEYLETVIPVSNE